MVKTLHFHCRGSGFDPRSGKFRMPRGVAKKKKKVLAFYRRCIVKFKK